MSTKSVASLNQDWQHYLELVQQLINSLVNHHNPEIIFNNLTSFVERAIEVVQGNSDDILRKVSTWFGEWTTIVRIEGNPCVYQVALQIGSRPEESECERVTD